MRTYNVLLAVCDPDLVASVRYDYVRAADQQQAIEIARGYADAQFGEHGWVAERVEAS